MDGQPDADGDRALMGVDNSAAEGDGDRGRYSGAQHATKLLEALARLRRDATLCDVRLHARCEPDQHEPAPAPECSDRSEPSEPSNAVYAHRAVLAACSPYFHAMFTQFDERTQPTVTIQNVEPSVLEAIVEYVYTPESLVISKDNVQSLLLAASLLQVQGVREACCAFLAAALAPDNALGIRAFAELHACAELCLCAQRYVEHHFVEVLESEEFLTLEADILAALLDSDRITVPNEEVVLDAVVRWMRHAPETRAGQLGALLEHVRLPLLAQDTLVARAAAEPLASAGLRVKDLVIEALSFHLQRPERRAAAASACARPRQPPKALLVMGGEALGTIRDVEAFHIECGHWRAAAELPTRRSRAGVASVGAKVYVVGGFNGTQRVSSVDVYDVGTDTWSAGPPMAMCRSTPGVVAIGHVIYAVGGSDGAMGLSLVEALDTREGTWRAMAPMPTPRSAVGVGVLGGKLYVVGGYDAFRALSVTGLQTVERYDPAADAWESVEDMGECRGGCGVGVAEGALYAVGGHNAPTVHRSVERYRPGQGWAPAPPMHTPRRNVAVASDLARLYVVGGNDGAVYHHTVEVFDSSTDSWSTLGAGMAVGRIYPGVAIVERAA